MNGSRAFAYTRMQPFQSSFTIKPEAASVKIHSLPRLGSDFRQPLPQFLGDELRLVSERMCFGIPCCSMASASVSITS
jgi:hypothetical protein